MRLLLVLASVSVLALAALLLRPDLASRSVAEARTEEVRMGGGVAAVTAPVQTFVQQQPYSIRGDTPDEVLASLIAGAPRTGDEAFFGLTTTELAFRYRHRQAADGCALRDVRVDLSVRVSMPEWTPGEGASYDLRRDWSRFESNLRRHEDYHRVLAEAGAEATRLQLDGLTKPTCAEADAEARTRAERVQVETESAHRRYDGETAHGRTQGAVWPVL